MPYRVFQLSFYPAVVCTGLALGAAGTIVQGAQEGAAARRAYAAYAAGVEVSPAPPAYHGTALAIAGTSMAVVAVVGKGLMDLVFAYKGRQKDMVGQLMEELKEANKKLGEASGDVANLTRQVEYLLSDNQELRQSLARLDETAAHIDKNVSHIKVMKDALTSKTADKTIENSRKIDKIAKAVTKLSGSDIGLDATTPDPKP